MKKKTKQILAILAIVLLLAMYAINLTLALIGSEAAQSMLKVTMVLSIMIPILLYAFLMLMRKNSGSHTAADDMTEEEKAEARRLMEEDFKEKDKLS